MAFTMVLLAIAAGVALVLGVIGIYGSGHRRSRPTRATISGSASTSACDRVEVHDAGAQHVAAADDGVGDEHLAAALQAIEQRRGSACRGASRPAARPARARRSRGHVAERRDAQRLASRAAARDAARPRRPSPATARCRRRSSGGSRRRRRAAAPATPSARGSRASSAGRSRRSWWRCSSKW